MPTCSSVYPFCKRWNDFSGRFIVMKPRTSESQSKLFLVPMDSSHSCSDRFIKYRAWVHFHSEPHSYVTQQNSPTPNEIMMKKDLKTLYWSLGYQKGFGPTEVKSSLHRKQSIDTYVIVGATNIMKRKEIFREGGVICFFHFFTYVFYTFK